MFLSTELYSRKLELQILNTLNVITLNTKHTIKKCKKKLQYKYNNIIRKLNENIYHNSIIKNNNNIVEIM